MAVKEIFGVPAGPDARVARPDEIQRNETASTKPHRTLHET